MCGITGVFNLNSEPVSINLVRRLTDAIAYRGPDGDGYYVQGPMGLGHRRLAIIDLSPAGRQPMANQDGNIVITYNGELYNYLEIRVKLQALGHRFLSNTDTEVVIYAYQEWGEACVEHFNGMYAFAIYDGRSPGGRLFLARDRFGVKPLYYYDDGMVFLFASEVKAILQHPAVEARVCFPALNEYFTFQNIFSDLTLFEGVRLLPAGCTLLVDPAASTPVKREQYWDYQVRHRGFTMSSEEAAEELRRLFVQAVSRQLIADVPVGSYLSGGIDSGSITAVAAHHIPRIHSFTAGFDLSSASGLEMAFDEREVAEAMANRFKTEHYQVVLHAGDMEQVLPELVWHLEDLRVGQSYPNYYVARLASKFVKVVLSGAGGDELFAGYPWRYYRGIRTNGAASYFQAYYDYWQRLIPDSHRAEFFTPSAYQQLKDNHPLDTFRSVFAQADLPLDTIEDTVNASLYFEIKTFLNGLLIVEDKLSMAHSLESRVPFLDNDLVDFALRIPPSYKLRDLNRAPQVDEDEPGKLMRYQSEPTADGKIIFRQAMTNLVPSEVSRRAKQGFSAPDASWFRGESVDYVNRLLCDSRARIYDYISPVYVGRVVNEHSAGQANNRLLIWSLLCFEWWLRKFIN